jgi:hypothetical protein
MEPFTHRSYSNLRRSNPISTRNKNGVVLISVGDQKYKVFNEDKQKDGGALMEVFNQFNPTELNATLQLNTQTR